MGACQVGVEKQDSSVSQELNLTKQAAKQSLKASPVMLADQTLAASHTPAAQVLRCVCHSPLALETESAAAAGLGWARPSAVVRERGWALVLVKGLVRELAPALGWEVAHPEDRSRSSAGRMCLTPRRW